MKNLFLFLIMTIALVAGACGGGKSDADLQKDVTDKLKASPGVTAAVKEGAVTLGGTVVDDTIRKNAEATAKAVEGVKSVKNDIQVKQPTMPAATMAPPATTTSPAKK